MKLKGSNAQLGYTRVDLLILAALAALAVVLLPLLMRPKRYPAGMHCLNNLRQVGMAYQH